MNHQDHPKTHKGDVLIPLIRTAATIGFAVAPCSLGFVVIAVSEQLIRSIMVGDDPEMLVSELQNQFPNDAIQVAGENEVPVREVVGMIDRGGMIEDGETHGMPVDVRRHVNWLRVRNVLKQLLPGTAVKSVATANLN